MTHTIAVVNEFGDSQSLEIPSERALTVYVDKRELVTLMTLGAQPEWLVLGYLLNQRLIQNVRDIESITVDWEVGAAAVKTYAEIANLKEKTERRVVTTGCGQGSVFGDLMADVDTIVLPISHITQAQIYGIVN
ncbi:MAG: formate dehydrogenase accessory sulfurtransferase FdhD, partial [Comamonadaceae bacterium]